MPSTVVERDRLDLKPNREVLSAPYLVEPLYACAIAVIVRGFVPHAELDVDVDGHVVTVAAGFPEPHGENVPLDNPLEAGQQVRVRQRTSVAESDWSAAITVRDHRADYPAGPPRPQINPAPVFACGSRTGVANLLPGGNVWITADDVEVGRKDGCSDHQGVNVDPDYSLDDRVRAHYELCADPAAPSVQHIAGPPPSPLPAPGIEGVEGSEQLRINTIVNGARVSVARNGTDLGTFRCWGNALLLGVNPPLATTDVFEAEQRMCADQPGSPTGSGSPLPCGSLPAPTVHPVQLGDDRIHVTSSVPGAIIDVFVNLSQAGHGSAPYVHLGTAVALGDVIHVVQSVGTCQGNLAVEITPECVAAPLGGNPAALDIYPVGQLEYHDGDVIGTVYYPAEDDGTDQPFNKRLGDLGRVPMVVLAHGNHSPADPSYLGYDYFQRHLAKMGMVAVSVDCNALNGSASGVGNIEDRADLVIASIAHLQALDAAPGGPLNGHIDFGRLGLMGHSRGGDAVVTIPTVLTLPGVTVRSVLALAPTNFRFWFGLSTIQPKGYAFMTILPAGDGDVRDNNGAQFYDQAVDVPYRSQLYVHNTNHNWFNRQWSLDEGQGPARMSRYRHEQVLSGYGCALFRDSLLGHGGMLDYLSGHRLPSGAPSDKVHLSFGWQHADAVDDHDEDNGIDTNSLGGPTSQTGLVVDEFAFHENPWLSRSPYNDTFFGQSLGMVLEPAEPGSEFRSEIPDPADVGAAEVWIRAAEVHTGEAPADPTSFELGLEDTNGVVAWVSSNGVGGVLRPYTGVFPTKTMLRTMRFRSECFRSGNRELALDRIAAIRIRSDRKNRQPIAFDDLQLVTKEW